MNRLTILLLLFLMLVMQNSLADLTLDPSSINVDLVVGQQEDISLSVSNNFNFTIYNLTISKTEDVTMNQIDAIEPNQTESTIIHITPTSEYDATRNTKIEFSFLTNIDEDPTFYDVEITDDNFSPIELVILNGDTVRWTNIGTVTHTVTHDVVPPLFDFSVSVNQTVQRLFSEIGQFNYHDETLFFGATIIANNRTTEQLTVNPDLFQQLSIHIESTFSNSILELEILESNYTLEIDETNSGALRLTNIGNETAFNIHLSGNWISFDSNDFDLDEANDKLVVFDIQPIILKTEDTNKTHTKTITVSGSNFPTITGDIDIFVKYRKISETTNLTREELTEELRRLRELLTNLDLSDGGDGTVVFRESEFSFNITETEFKALLLRNAEVSETLKRMSNLQTELDKKNSDFIASVNGTLSELKEEDIKQNERFNTQRATMYIIIFGAVFITFILAVFKFVEKYSKTERFMRFYGRGKRE